jgi:hypothetical protein
VAGIETAGVRSTTPNERGRSRRGSPPPATADDASPQYIDKFLAVARGSMIATFGLPGHPENRYHSGEFGFICVTGNREE